MHADWCIVLVLRKIALCCSAPDLVQVVAEHWHHQALALVVRPVKPLVCIGWVVHVDNHL